MTCWLKHRWSAWKVVDKGAVTQKELRIGSWLLQERRCTRCEYVEINLQQPTVYNS